MKCPEIRNEIESIEDLKDKAHNTPDSVASHIGECSNCGKYYETSQVLEREIFNKIKDIKGAVIPAGLIRQKPRRKSFFRNLLIAVPLAGAALVALIIYIGEADLTEILMKQTAAGIIPFKEADSNTVSEVFSGFHEKTGVKASLPAYINSNTITKAALISFDASYVCAFTCKAEKTEYTVFIYDSSRAHWSCCGNAPCTCLSKDSCKAERWKKGKLGYLVVTPSLSARNTHVSILHGESGNG